ncbi:MAG: DNA polymerase III subunit delta [Thiohalocapsa sp.]|jgi:DNA polymerase-3 subunit delta|uniref:DNA polymerase III subunit delta n=1 Tax=Thiohalocapsa sp. TaxID=2497641 RepID=UPI0025F0E121|nr:DNA polymerase III subunit delta [Thiohalocapsa sp.]MCG6942481.1 DNA polymerase III subunit delta [Thiohalocapsa sp.]
MRLDPAQLDAGLERALAPIYLIFGDEPLQLGEAAAAVRTAAGTRGFSERTCLEADAQFDWTALDHAAASLSLFAERRLIEVRLAGEGPGRDGADAIRRYCAAAAGDVLLLIVAPKLDWKTLSSKWAQALDQAGVIVQVRQPQGQRLQQWLRGRLVQAGFRPTDDALALLAERVEGNLLAAAQEVEKLKLLRQPGPLDAEALLASVYDSARYDLFDLSDAALAGDRARTDRVLRALQAEGTAAALVLWVLARELRKLAAVGFALANRGNTAAVLREHKVTEYRRNEVIAAARRLPLPSLWALLARCADADLAVKGRSAADPWRVLAEIADGLAATAARAGR